MPHPTGPTNPELAKLIEELRRLKTPFHLKLVKHLAKPARSKHGVTLFKINKIAVEGDNVFVPYKVLATGDLNKRVNVYAWRYSATAKNKIAKSGGKALKLNDALKDNVKGRIVV